MSNSVQAASDIAAFSSREVAENFLARFLPIATAKNPRYRSDQAGVAMAWITRDVKFAPDKTANGISVSMSEEVLEFRNGAQTSTGSHQVEFSLGDVKISERRDGADLTESGEIALGVIFNCHSGKCIRSTYNGQPSSVDWTDISIQDDALRGQVLKAFEAVQQAPGEPNAPAGAKTP
jgi:hypothetical protein